MQQTQPFCEQSVIITGASSGIGRALALRLADQGAWLTLAARDAGRLEALAQECQPRGGKAIAVPTDIRDEDQCQAMVQRTIEAYQKVDMLVNNAGIAVTALFEELHDLSLFKQVMEVNFYGMLYCSYHALPYLKQSRGRLVNISSLGGKLALPYNTPYISSKFAMHGFSDTLRMELAKHGVSVTVVCPYWVVTEFHERYMNKDGQPKGPSGRALYTDKMMTADECARRVLLAAEKRKREVLMFPGVFGVWLNRIAPRLYERMVVEVVLKPIVKRVKASNR